MRNKAMDSPPKELKHYHYMDTIVGAQKLEPSKQQLSRRRLAQAVQQLSNATTRIDASEEEMDRLTRKIEAVNDTLSEHTKVDSIEIFKRLYSGRASKDDLIFDADSNLLLGKSSPIGFHMELEVQDSKIIGEACIPIPFQGPPNRVHGGIVATVMDILLSRTQILSDFLGFTADLQVSYKRAVPIDEVLTLEAWIESVDDRMLINRGRISCNGKTCATAKGLWIKPKTEFI